MTLGEDLARQFISDLSDYLEFQLNNSQFADRLEVAIKPTEIKTKKRVAFADDQNEEYGSFKRIKYNGRENSPRVSKIIKSEKYFAKTGQFKDITTDKKKTTEPKLISFNDVSSTKASGITTAPIKVEVVEEEAPDELFNRHWAKKT